MTIFFTAKFQEVPTLRRGVSSVVELANFVIGEFSTQKNYW